MRRLSGWPFGAVLLAALVLPAARAFAPPVGKETALPEPDRADSPGEDVDILFERLKSAHDGVEAALIEGMILEAWGHSSSDTATLLYDRGLEASANDDPELALELFTATTELAPDFAEGWHQLGALNFTLEAHDAALIDLERALRLEPRHFGALMGLAAIFELYGNEKGALEALRQARDLDPHLEGVEERIRSLEIEVEGQGI